MEPIVITGSFFLLIYGIIKLKSQEKERKMLIQAGFDPTQKTSSNAQTSTLTLLKWGIIFVGVGLGLFGAEFVENVFQMDEETAFFSMVLIFGGVSFIISHVIVSKRIKKQENQKENSEK